MGLGRLVPAAMEERGDGLEGVGGCLASDDRVQGRERRREPRLVLTELRRLQPDFSCNRDADGHHARRDQRKLADAFRMAPHVQRGQVRAGRVREQVHLVDAQVLA